MDADGTDARLLTTSLDRQCARVLEIREPLWDGDRLVFTRRGRRQRPPLRRRRGRLVGAGAARRRRAGDRQLRRPRGELAYVASTHTTLRELYAGTRGPAARRTSARRSPTARALVGRAVHGGLEGRHRGRRVARLDRPASRRASATRSLLDIHGGPFTQYGTGFFDEFQVYAGAGYAVLFSNPRGGSGYSRGSGAARSAARSAAPAPAGARVDYEDVMASSTRRSSGSTSSTPTGSASSAARTAAS